MKTKIGLILLVLTIGFTSCENEKVTTPAVDNTGIIDNNDDNEDNNDDSNYIMSQGEIVEFSNSFGVELFQKIAIDEEDENMLFCPISANIAFHMLLNGACNNTYTQILEMLGYESNISIEQVNETYKMLLPKLLNSDPAVTLKEANSIFHDNKYILNDEFTETLNDVYHSHIEGLNFSNVAHTIEVINQWASDHTEGLIDQVLSEEEISPETTMFMLNAIYFKGDWTYQFNENDTNDEIFTLMDGTRIMAQTMSAKFPIKLDIQDDYFTCELSYGNNNFVMDIIAPTNITDFLATFDIDKYNTIVNNIENTDTTSLNVFLPKFTIEYEKRLNELLKAMGMTDAFNEMSADFCNLSDLGFIISFIKQNTFMRVDEIGTEAAGVTVIGGYTDDSNQENVNINRPFIYSIRERSTNTLLFIGTMLDPR